MGKTLKKNEGEGKWCCINDKGRVWQLLKLYGQKLGNLPPLMLIYRIKCNFKMLNTEPKKERSG